MTVFLICFAVLSLVHLFACYFEHEHLRKVTKPLILASLAVFYALSAREFDLLVLLALICGLFGDILLLWPKHKKTFLAGACIFALGHAFYAIKLYTLANAIGTGAYGWPLMLIIAAYIAQIIVATLRLSPHIEDSLLTKLMPVYFGMVALINIGAWMFLLSAFKEGEEIFQACLAVTGGILFLVSDTVLATALFKGNIKRPNFYVMITYIAAQLSLCMGFTLL